MRPLVIVGIFCAFADTNCPFVAIPGKPNTIIFSPWITCSAFSINKEGFFSDKGCEGLIIAKSGTSAIFSFPNATLAKSETFPSKTEYSIC